MFTRKSLFIALTVIAMLAMLVPATFAAPEQVAAVTIQSPTEAIPVWVTSPGTFPVMYNIQEQGPQIEPVAVRFRLHNQDLPAVAVAREQYQPPRWVPAAPVERSAPYLCGACWPSRRLVPSRICINDGYDPYCTMQRNSVRIDNTGPTVVLERPVNNDACTWVTGNKYELFGYATDNFAVVMPGSSTPPTSRITHRTGLSTGCRLPIRDQIRTTRSMPPRLGASLASSRRSGIQAKFPTRLQAPLASSGSLLWTPLVM